MKPADHTLTPLLTATQLDHHDEDTCHENKREIASEIQKADFSTATVAAPLGPDRHLFLVGIWKLD